MANRTNLMGRRFGMLTVIGDAGHKGVKTAWLCRCDCGKEVAIITGSLLSGKSRSCGCNNIRNTTHGGTHTRLYAVYLGMKARCYNPQSIGYKHYGALGVTVCDEWKNDYSAFRRWAYANGYDETTPLHSNSCTLDRINPFGNYEPSNCRWVDAYTQSHNKRSDWERSNNVSTTSGFKGVEDKESHPPRTTKQRL